MNILLVDQISSINWKYTFSLANALKEQKNNVIVISDLFTSQRMCRCQIIKLFNTDSKKITKLSKLKNYISSYRKIFRILKKEKIDVIHLQWITFSPLDYFFFKKIRKLCKIVLTIHDIIAFDSHFYDKFFYKRVYQIPNAIILQTRDNVTKFKSMFPKIDKNKIFFSPHGHFLEFAKNYSYKESRIRLKLPEKSFIFLFFGQIKKVKGLDLLIKAFSKLSKKYEDCFLLIAGNPWHTDFLQYDSLIKELDIENKVVECIKFIPDEDVDYYFSASNVVCLPYTEIYQSGVAQLSYAYKKPAIVSNLPGFLTIVEDGKNGYVFKNGDWNDLSNKMEKAYLLKNNLPFMGLNGYKKIESNFSWKKIAITINNIYHKIC